MEPAEKQVNAGGWIWHATCDNGGTSLERTPMSECWYLVSNRRTQQYCDVVAASPEAACTSRGWQATDCVVLRVAELVAPGSAHGPTNHVPESDVRGHQPAEKS